MTKELKNGAIRKIAKKTQSEPQNPWKNIVGLPVSS